MVAFATADAAGTSARWSTWKRTVAVLRGDVAVAVGSDCSSTSPAAMPSRDELECCARLDEEGATAATTATLEVGASLGGERDAAAAPSAWLAELCGVRARSADASLMVDRCVRVRRASVVMCAAVCVCGGGRRYEWRMDATAGTVGPGAGIGMERDRPRWSEW